MKIYKINYSNNYMGGNDDSSEFKRKNYKYTYGELTKDGLESILKNINCTDKIFYDLGSGKGNVIINSIKLYPSFKKVLELNYQTRYGEALEKLDY